MAIPEIVSSHEIGKLQIKHLKRYWNKSILIRDRKLNATDLPAEWKTDTTLLTVVGVGLEPTIQYLYQYAPSFEQFEDWITKTSGKPDADKVNQFNKLFDAENSAANANQTSYEILTPEDIDFWGQNGYVIIRNAITKESCDQTIEAICNFIEIDRYDQSTWYNAHSAKQGIMIQLFHHPAIEQNRKAYKIKKAYEELWQRTDIWANADRVGFNPPETQAYPFQGPRLHWDVSIKPPIPFGTQGILYLADTAENQGAFTVVPGFQNKVEEWLNSLPAGVDPRRENLYALGPKPIAANAGDFIIWHQALPHGSSPNTSLLPRFVQYINYAPADEKEAEEWI